MLGWILSSFVIVASAAPNKLTCTGKELAGRDCRLMSGSYNLRLLKKTIAWNDGTWHTVDPMPLVGEGIEWEKVRFEFIGKQPVLQMWLWDNVAGPVQSLHWYVADAEKRKLTILAEGVVRKRTLKEALPTGEGEAAAADDKKPKAKPKYLYDAFEKHGLRLLKDGGLEWSLGREKKILEKKSSAAPTSPEHKPEHKSEPKKESEHHGV